MNKAFWETKQGKNIISIGKWMFAVGIINIPAFMYGFFIFINAGQMTPLVTGYLIYVLLIGFKMIYFILNGRSIYKKQLEPSEIKTICLTSIFIILGIFIMAITINSAIDTGYAAATQIPIFDAIILYDCIKYCRKLHKPYVDAYENIIEISPKPTPKEAVIKTKKINSDNSEDFDDLDE